MNKFAPLRQDPREFTVQILHSSDDRIVGTGVVVCRSGKVVTCKHVLLDAGLDCKGKLLPRSFFRKLFPLRNPVSGTVGIVFPKVQRRKEMLVRAVPVSYFLDTEDDVVLLQIIGETPYFLSEETVAKIGSAEPSSTGKGNSFKALGFRRIGSHDSLMATGTITMCEVAKEGFQGGVVHLTQLQIDGRRLIDRGMSGSAVLDTDRDLVIGVVYEVSAPVAWAVDAAVLGIPPMQVPILEDRKPPLATHREDEIDFREPDSQEVRSFEWNEAVGVDSSFVERPHLSLALNEDWKQPERCVSVIVGFGGDGKSWLVRKWLEDRFAGSNEMKEGFWWSFGIRPNADDFFDFAFRYFGLRKPAPSENARVGAKLARELIGRHAVLVLDGLDALQQITGPQLGELTNSDVRDFLQEIARLSAVGVRCLITTRVPVMDLNNYPGSTAHDLPRLTTEEGCTLLRKLGVRDTNDMGGELRAVVERCAGHAMTISIVGALLVEDYGGDVSRAREFFPRKLNTLPDESVAALLRSYEKRLGAAEKEFLTIFSAFRRPVEHDAFSSVFRNSAVNGLPNATLNRLTEDEMTGLVNRLVRLQLVRREENSGAYSLHTFVRSYYVSQLESLPGRELHALHRTIRDYFELKKKPEFSNEVSVGDLAPLIEAIHHGCAARDFARASDTFWRDVSGEKRDLLVHRLGALTTDLEIIREFFPESDFQIDPLVADKRQAIWLINEAGICHVALGYLKEAAEYLERASRRAEALTLWNEAATSMGNLAASRCLLGDLRKAKEDALAGQEFAGRVAESSQSRKLTQRALALQGWIALWMGDTTSALSLFEEADHNSGGPDRFDWLNRAEGIRYGDALLANGHKSRARTLGRDILTSARAGRLVPLESMAFRLLGDVYASEDDSETAKEYYDNAVALARSTTRREILIEALLRRGRHERLGGEVGLAEQDLREAIRESCDNDYRPFEASSRSELSKLLLKTARLELAQVEQAKARRLSENTGYLLG